jgi:hypothetical protein
MVGRVRAIRRTVHWAWLLEVARVAPVLKGHWDRLTPAERRQLQTLIRKSKGRPSNLTLVERATVRRLVRKLELGRLGRDLTTIVRSRQQRKPK